MHDRLISRPALQRKENQNNSSKNAGNKPSNLSNNEQRMLAIQRIQRQYDALATAQMKAEEEKAAQMKAEEEKAAQMKEEEETAQMKEEEETAQMKEEEETAQMKEEEEETAQMKEEEDAVQMQEEEEAAQMQEEEEAAQMKEEEEAAQMKEGASGKNVSAGRQTKMPGHVQQKMETGLGADFGGVRIHQDSDKASRLGALAYTQGEDVYFAPGQYKPESQKGQELIGHELQHVVQQREGRVKANEQRKGQGVNTENSLEREADIKGKAAAEGESNDGKHLA